MILPMIPLVIHRVGSISSFAALVLIWAAVFKGNKRTAVLCSNGDLQFAPSWWFICSWIYLLLRFLFTGMEYLQTGMRQPIQLVTGTLICVAAACGFPAMPGKLFVSKDGIEEVNWYWRNKKIRWSEIREIRTGKQLNPITAMGPASKRIVYSNVYPERARFLSEIKRYCAENLASDFPVDDGRPTDPSSLRSSG